MNRMDFRPRQMVQRGGALPTSGSGSLAGLNKPTGNAPNETAQEDARLTGVSVGSHGFATSVPVFTETKTNEKQKSLSQDYTSTVKTNTWDGGRGDVDAAGSLGARGSVVGFTRPDRGRKFYIVMAVLCGAVGIVFLSFALVLTEKLPGDDWVTFVQWIFSNVVSFAGGYMSGNFAQKARGM